jgi:CheY-like chemotaxis protein
LVHDAAAELWADSRVKCVLVPRGKQMEVELRNADGSPFLRKTAPTRQAALNEAEYLRLLVSTAERSRPSGGLKPFALVIESDTQSDAASGEKDGPKRDALSNALRLSGIRALGCRSEADPESLAWELSPDLIVIDVGESDGRSAGLCRRLRDDPRTAATPIIAVTSAPEVLRAQGCQADAVLSAPCQIDTLLAAARLFLRHLSAGVDAVS